MDEKEKCTCNETCECNEEKCNCDETCECGCNEEEKCTCDETCECGCNEEEKCTCNETCECGCNEEEKCNCEETCECGCNEEKKMNKKEKKEHKKNKQQDKEIYENKIKELEEKILKEKAELINYRKRKDEEVTKMLKYSNEEIVTELLPIIDNFESAIQMDDNNLDDEVSKFLKGFKMVYGNIVTVLEKFDIKAIDGINKPFDPAYHQAVLTEKCDAEPGLVIDVLRKGYILKDKVIRPAMVKVSE